MSQIDNALSLQIVGAVVSYSLCSSTLLLANKSVMQFLPRPSVISLFQVVASLIIMYALTFFGVKIDRLEWPKVKLYSIYVFAFTLSRYANMKALHHSNIETVVVFRACVPLVVTFIEYLFMGRSLPTARAALSLSIVSIGAALYCISDSEFSMNGLRAYSWVSLYFVLLTFEMTYCKQLTSSAKMTSKWGPVFYCNSLATLPIVALGVATGEFDNLASDLNNISFNGVLVLLFSCVAGTFIGYTSWACIELISATSYTLVGVVNKFITVLLNVLIWDKHSTPAGLVAVCLCLGGGFFYEQAPLRPVLLHGKAVDRERHQKCILLLSYGFSITTAYFALPPRKTTLAHKSKPVKPLAAEVPEDTFDSSKILLRRSSSFELAV